MKIYGNQRDKCKKPHQKYYYNSAHIYSNSLKDMQDFYRSKKYEEKL